MILESVLNLISLLLKSIFSILPNIPQLEVTASFQTALSTIFGNLDLLGCFIRPATFYVIVPAFVIIYNFEHIYHLTMWIIKKLPININ